MSGSKIIISLENGQQIITMCLDDLVAKINADEGANLFVLKNEKKKLDILVSKDDPNDREIDFPYFGMPILFPPNRIAGGRFSFNGRDYVLPINDAPGLENHVLGFLFFEKWRTKQVRVDEKTCCVTMQYTSSDKSFFYDFFPHLFTVEIEFILTQHGIVKTTTIINNDVKPMPLGLGWHTFFKIPFSTDGDGDACVLNVTVGKEWVFDENYIPTGEMRCNGLEVQCLTGEGFHLSNNAICKHFGAKPIILNERLFNGAIITDKSNGRKLYYEVGNEFGHWMLWNASGNEGFICPEPQTIAADGFNLQNRTKEDTGFIALNPEKVFCTYEKIFWE